MSRTPPFLTLRTEPARNLCSIAACLAAAVSCAPASAMRHQESRPVAASRAATPSDDAEARIRQLEAENSALQQRVNELQAQLDRVRGTAPDTATHAAPLDPFASPASLAAELKRRYARQLGDLPRTTQAQRDRFESQARRWCERTQSEVRGRTRWLAQITDVRTPERSAPDAMIRVLDEFTQKPLGEAARVPITHGVAERLASLRHNFERRHDRTAPGEAPELAYELSVLVIAAPEFNPDRVDAGVFDVPPFVGPCVDFGMKLDIELISMVELEREVHTPVAKTAPGPDAARPSR